MQTLDRKKIIQAALCTGIAGSLIMFIGDMLLYWNPAHTGITPESVIYAMRQNNDYRIMAGGAVGPFATLLYCIGFFGLAQLILPEHPRIRGLLLLLFCLGSIYGGAAYHALFPILAFAPDEGGIGVIPRVQEYLDFIATVAFSFWTLASLLFQFSVFRGWTICRKRIVFLAPFPLAFLIFPLIHLPPPFLIIFAGGWYCHMITLFFAACLWEVSRESALR